VEIVRTGNEKICPTKTIYDGGGGKVGISWLEVIVKNKYQI